MSKKKVYDWDTLRIAFVSGDMDLITLARETTKLDSSPAYISLKKHAARENWTDLRKAYQRNVLAQVSSNPQAEHAIKKVEQLIDSAETIMRHVQIAKSLQGMSASLQKKLNPAIAGLKLEAIEKLSPRQMALLLKDLAGILAIATELERRAMGLPEPTTQIEAEVRYVVAMPDESPSIEQWSDRWTQELAN